MWFSFFSFSLLNLMLNRDGGKESLDFLVGRGDVIMCVVVSNVRGKRF